MPHALRAPFARLPLVAVLLLLGGGLLWRSQLIGLAPSTAPRALTLLAPAARIPQACDVVLPAAPVGMVPLRSGHTPLLIHYWAPWERHGRAQAAGLDSLARTLRDTDLRIVLVSFDPFPSVARFVARQRLRLRVVLDGPGELRAQVPCPRIPHTVLIDRAGRAAAIQSGEIDWLAPATRAALERVLREKEFADSAAGISARQLAVPPVPAPVLTRAGRPATRSDRET